MQAMTDDISRDWLMRAVQYAVNACDPVLVYPELGDLNVIKSVF